MSVTIDNPTTTTNTAAADAVLSPRLSCELVDAYVRAAADSRLLEAAQDVEEAIRLREFADALLNELAQESAVSSGQLRLMLNARVHAQIYPNKSLLRRLLRR